MITLVVDSEKILKETIIVDNLADINHIKNVFRKNIGETIRAVDGKFEYICEIKEIENRTLKLKILSSREENSSEIEIEAGISLLKNIF
ncbi:MAG: 16S rRNA (uracil(1498)-N(3))-methyltransferase [Fusobacterium sp.]|nr:16S rRNA (uracil(1498)-N(3))-methyltransferase [Fusobacterium sp.]